MKPTRLEKAATQILEKPSACATASASFKRAFCPHMGQVGAATSQLSRETGQLLRSRLRAVCALLLTANGLFLVRNLFLPEHPFWVLCVGEFLVLAVCTGLLQFSKRQFTLGELRILELVVFGSMAVYIFIIHYQLAEYVLARGGGLGQQVAGASIFRPALAFFALIAAYGMFIPNSWRRAALVVTPLAAAPLALTALQLKLSPAFRAVVAPTLTFEELSGIGLVMLIALLIAVLGAQVIHSIRSEVAHAREMGMYQLKEKIGEGGMGEVWRAEHSLLTRPAAIKMIKADSLGDDGHRDTAVERFQREARATASLRSPHTIELYDFGVTRDDTLYYVMEYLDGLNLDALVRRFGAIPAERAVYLLRQAVSSLDEAHRSGLIHRDIKPANMHVGSMGVEHDFVKVLDFGLVKMRGGADTAAVTLTREDSTTGTPAYMPPEMAVGKPPVDHRTDIYALGCVAYWLLTGKLVFESGSPMELIVDHVKTPPVPPSERTANPIPAELDGLVMACLEKDQARRPQSMTELGERLDACPLVEPWTQARAGSWWRQNMPPVAERQVA